jgi:hypothetical protein
MTTARVLATFQGRTQKPEDVFVNTWHFDTGGQTLAQSQEEIYQLLTTFYVLAPPGSSRSIASYYSRFIDPPLSTLRMYDLADPEPRQPTVLGFTYTPGAELVDYPEEVAVCMSFRGAAPRTNRRRGRLYLGPFNSAAAEPDAAPGGAGPSRPATTMLIDIGRSATRLLGDSLVSPVTWVIRSVTPSPNNVEVVNGWVDDAWDTQRRRGVDPAVRYNWPVGIPG